MFAKLIALILGMGFIGGGLLAARQTRLQAASELAQARMRISRADDRLLSMRAQIGAAITPARVEAVAAASGTLRPATNDIPRALLAKELKGLMPEVIVQDARRTINQTRRAPGMGERRVASAH